MRFIIVGYGVQGKKRVKIAGAEAAGIVDPIAPEADWKRVQDVPDDRYDAALVCAPDDAKMDILHHLLTRKKHTLTEKPLYAARNEDILALQDIANGNGLVCYTAYNHRFEPHFVHMRDILAGGTLGKLYRCRMFYGNGTARLVRDSAWRDRGAGVLPDLGSHLLDTARFWFGDVGDDFAVTSVSRFENAAPDHVVIASETSHPKIELEMTLLSWRNHFTCDIFAENGSAHIESLCKWGPATLTLRHRILPSGRPTEDVFSLTQEDPTWKAEFDHFKALIARGAATDLGGDVWLNGLLGRLSATAISGNVAR